MTRPEDVPIRQAASVLVIDDRPDLHVLIGRRRRSSGFVPGMVVFPGGAVDDDDRSAEARLTVPTANVSGLAPDVAAAFLHAGLRETFEEVGLWVGGGIPVEPDDFPHAGWWLTPLGAPRRYDTHFFLARHHGGKVVPDRLEITDAWWERPAEVLGRVEAGDLDAILPTIEFLRALSRYDRVESVLRTAADAPSRQQPSGWVGF